MPFFSVIVPTFNRLALLQSTVASIFAQGCRDYELIIVDDGSAEYTIDYLEAVEKATILRQANQGPGSARNLGAKNAKGEYLAFLDSDDLWFPWSLQIYQHVIDRYNSPAFIAGKPYRFKSECELEPLRGGEVKGELFSDYLASGDQWRWWGASSFVVHRAAFLSVGGFTDDWVNGEDADLALRLGVAPGFFQIHKPVTFGYREHAVSAMKDGRRTAAGAWSQVRAERAGRYPGGRRRGRERRRILTRHVRPVTLACARQGFQRDAWGLYLSTFLANAAQGHFTYLFAFPLIALAHKLMRLRFRRL